MKESNNWSPWGRVTYETYNLNHMKVGNAIFKTESDWSYCFVLLLLLLLLLVLLLKTSIIAANTKWNLVQSKQNYNFHCHFQSRKSHHENPYFRLSKLKHQAI